MKATRRRGAVAEAGDPSAWGASMTTLFWWCVNMPVRCSQYTQLSSLPPAFLAALRTTTCASVACQDLKLLLLLLLLLLSCGQHTQLSSLPPAFLAALCTTACTSVACQSTELLLLLLLLVLLLVVPSCGQYTQLSSLPPAFTAALRTTACTSVACQDLKLVVLLLVVLGGCGQYTLLLPCLQQCGLASPHPWVLGQRGRCWSDTLAPWLQPVCRRWHYLLHSLCATTGHIMWQTCSYCWSTHQPDQGSMAGLHSPAHMDQVACCSMSVLELVPWP